MEGSLTIIDPKLVESVRKEAFALIEGVFKEARSPGAAATADGIPPLFPHGVELIRVKFELVISEFAKAGVEVEVAGPKPGP